MARKLLSVKNPVLKNGVHYMTSDFGVKRTYTNTQGVKKTDTHKGVDLIGKDYAADYVLAFADGIVEVAGYHADCGYWVRIKHDDQFKTRYMHMKKGSLAVKVGDAVKKGQVLGYMGATGNVTGVHLHFDVASNGTYIDPKPFLDGTKTIGVASSVGTKQTIEQVARDVLAGKYGNGAERKKALEAKEYNYAEVQAVVNKLAKGKGNYFPRYTGQSNSLVDALKAVGVNSSLAYRKKIANANGIKAYFGTATQNITLLVKLKAGTLIKP